MGFFFLGDDANTYLAKMRQGWEGNWLWFNRYTTEPGSGAWFFLYWIALGHLAALMHLSLLGTFHLARVAGAFALLAAAWLFIERFVEDPKARRFAICFLAFGLGMGYVLQAIGKPVIFGQQSDTLDWRMPELSAFYSILALPHFIWAAAFQAAATVWTLKAAERGSVRWGALAGLAWLGEVSIHAQMPILLGPAVLIALIVRPPAWRGWLAAGLAFALPAPYVLYSYYASTHAAEVLRWSAQWRNNLPPDGVSLALALLPQLVLAALVVPRMLRRRSREDVFLLAWFVLLAAILWLPNPAGNLRRRFFDGIYLGLVVMAARGMYEVVLPRLRTVRARRLVPFSYVAFASIASLFLLLAPMLSAQSKVYSLPRPTYDALLWLAGRPPGIVLSSGATGLYVPAYTPDTVYVGQYSETFNYVDKYWQAKRLLTGRDDLRAFVVKEHVRYVLWTGEFGGSPPTVLGPPTFYEAGAAVFEIRT